jgi:glucans biosynthesis protein
MATRTGLGGIVGQKRSYYSWRFAVDFAGGDFGLVGPRAQIKTNVTASSGRVELTSARPLSSINGWRVLFDIVPTPSTDPIDLRLFLSYDGQPLTETWLYQWSPPPVGERFLE